jgi:cytochrome c peroxidase
MSRLACWRIRWTLLFGIWVLAFIPALRSQSTGSQASPPPQGAGQSGASAGTQGTGLPTVHVTTPNGPARIVTFGPNRPAGRLADMVMRVPADNPITDAKTALGRRLFFDRLLSSDRSVSCATCHDPERAFADTRTLAVGVFSRVGKRHAPALVNRGFGRMQFWDGRAATLEKQVLQPIEDRNEMDLPMDEAIRRLDADESYRTAFQTAFERPISADDVARALATYVRTIRSGDAPYDRFVAGDTEALSLEQQRGLEIFRSRARCSFCHREPLFTDEAFWNTGVALATDEGAPAGTYKDEGRFAMTGIERDRGSFKTPTLREIARTAPYMHDGSLATLADVVEFYDKGGRPNRNMFPLIAPLRLSAEDKQALVKFLESLNGVVSGK